MKSRVESILCAIWGLAEATVFFIVPDVLITCAIAHRPRPWREIMAPVLWTLVGALVGGAALYLWTVADASSAARVLAHVPGINAALIDRVGAQVEASGPLATFLGPITGTPYKLYAHQSALHYQPLVVFMLISIPARAVRFLLMAFIANGLCRRPLAHWSPRTRVTLALLMWSAFYAYYFAVMGW
jgi:membrane protein YqaA with SNARE-associated domain